MKRPKLVKYNSSSGLALEQLQVDLIYLVSKCSETKGYSLVACNSAIEHFLCLVGLSEEIHDFEACF